VSQGLPKIYVLAYAAAGRIEKMTPLSTSPSLASSNQRAERGERADASISTGHTVHTEHLCSILELSPLPGLRFCQISAYGRIRTHQWPRFWISETWKLHDQRNQWRLNCSSSAQESKGLLPARQCWAISRLSSPLFFISALPRVCWIVSTVPRWRRHGGHWWRAECRPFAWDPGEVCLPCLCFAASLARR